MNCNGNNNNDSSSTEAIENHWESRENQSKKKTEWRTFEIELGSQIEVLQKYPNATCTK